MEVTAGQLNFRGSLPRSENNVLQTMLHPDMHNILAIMRLTDSSCKYTAEYELEIHSIEMINTLVSQY